MTEHQYNHTKMTLSRYLTTMWIITEVSIHPTKNRTSKMVYMKGRAGDVIKIGQYRV